MVEFAKYKLLAKHLLPLRNRYILFYCILYVILLAIYIRNYYLSQSLVLSFIVTSFYVAIVYINHTMLFPIAKAKGKFLHYMALLALLSLLLTPMKSFLLFVTARAFDPKSVIHMTRELSEMFKFLWNNFISLILVGVLSTIVFIFAGWIQSQRAYRELQNKSIASELDFLKSQINPHFLFNTLNNLYALTLKKSDNAPEVVLKLSNMMRYMLYECNEAMVPLAREIEYVQNYIDLETLRFAKKVDLRIDIQGEADDLRVPPLLLVPFMENAFKHGLQDNIDGSYLDVKLIISDRLIQYTVENSKITIKPGLGYNERRVGGIGLKNLRRRLELLYPEKHQMHLEESPAWYRASLSLLLSDEDILPIHKQKNLSTQTVQT